MEDFKLYLVISLLLLGSTVRAEKDYSFFVRTIGDQIKKAPFAHSAWDRLAFLTDSYGPRMWGSETLEMAIGEMYRQAVKEGFENVRLEPVTNFTKWVRGDESLVMTSPRNTPLKLIGLGGSVAGTVEADVIVVSNYAQLQQMASQVPGKIVCFNNKWINYSESVDYRVNGASMAAKYGAKAMLVRSVASDSVQSVHTGYMEYDTKVPKIPCAAIAVEDAQMFARMQQRKQKITVKLQLESKLVDGCKSNNLVFEIMGTTYPDQVILAGGHIDSWDTGSQTGANDDGGGFITVFEALRLLLKTGFRAKRTLRFIAWSGEEAGSDRDGSIQYVERHLAEMPKHIAAFQSDLGSTQLIGFGHTGTGADIVKMVLTRYLSMFGASQYSDDGESVDVEPLNAKGVPIFKNLIKDSEDHEFYFRYHHSAGDSMTMMDPDEMDSNVVGIAAFLYIIADLDQTVRSVPQQSLRFEV